MEPAAGAAETPYHILFDRVSFSYNGKRDNLTDISFALKRGETLGIIGPTGSGKSTIINLLMRFYDVDSGKVLIDGEEVRSIPFERLRKMFGVVFQNDTIFADTIRENIGFGRSLSDEQVTAAAQYAQAASFIGEIPEGLQHRVTARGTNVSGGQKQRLLIARALAAKPEILVLDDASSALDYKTDANLRQAIRENFSGVTTVIVAQRVSSIKHADHILVLEDGREIGYGTHSELMRNCPSYREIGLSQMGGDCNAAD